MSAVTHVSLPALALLLVTAPAESAPLSRFDGRWSVLVVANQGTCSAYRYAVDVDHGRARVAGSGDVTVSASISRAGVLRGSIPRGGDSAEVQGRFSNASGSGSWRTLGRSPCSGAWTAERRPSAAMQG